MSSRWPQINLEDVHWGIYEPEGGFLTARIACQAVLDGFLAEGGEYKQLAVTPRDLDGGSWNGLVLSDGSSCRRTSTFLRAVRGCGNYFPKPLATGFVPLARKCSSLAPLPVINVSMRPICRFGPIIATHSCMASPAIRAEVLRSPMTRGDLSLPNVGRPKVSAEGLKSVRDYIAFRFPALKERHCWSPASASMKTHQTITSSSTVIRIRKRPAAGRRIGTWIQAWSSTRRDGRGIVG